MSSAKNEIRKLRKEIRALREDLTHDRKRRWFERVLAVARLLVLVLWL